MQTTFDTLAASGVDGAARASPPAADLAIEARGLTKTYTLYPSPRAQLLDLLGIYRLLPWRAPRFGHHVALHGVDLAIRRGERVGVIGRNGAGKTTLLKLITGFSEATAGTVRVDGRVQALMQVGLGFHPEFSGRENIRAALMYTGLGAEERASAAADVVAFCELGDYLDQPLKTYSLGMQSRLQFACATAIKPEILIVDEILGAGDAYFSAKSSQRMERLTKSGCTLLLVSHSMAQILQFCERCIWIDGGRVVADGTARKVVGEYEVFMESLTAGLMGHAPVAPHGSAPEGKSFRLGQVGEGDGDAADAGDGPAGEAPPGERFVDTLDSGERVFRWPSLPGPKLVAFDILLDGKPTRRFREGAEVLLRVRLRNDSGLAVDCRYQITIFSLANRRLTRFLSPIDQLTGIPGETREATLLLAPCLLQAGEYYVNFALLPHDAMRAGIPARRYDLVSRFCDFQITRTLDYRDGCVFNHPGQWRMSPAGAAPAAHDRRPDAR